MKRLVVLPVVGLTLLVVAGCPQNAGAPPLLPKANTPAEAGVEPLAENDAGEPVPMLDPLATYGYGEHRPRRDPNDLCEPVRENLERSMKELLGPHPNYAAAPSKPFDHKTGPKYLPIVEKRYLLSANEKSMLMKNGFVVPARTELRGYADALHDIYQSQMPLYVSADAILYSVYQANDSIMAAVERDMQPKLDAMLGKMHDTLPAMNGELPPEVARDLDVYLTVARALLAEDETAPAAKLGTDAESKAIIDKAQAGTGGLTTENLFGRPRVVDYSQFAPRGHYAKDPTLTAYFKASMWLSRLEFNLVSRGSRSSQPGLSPNTEETPREAVDALALANLAERAQVLGDLDKIEALWSNFAGKREDISLRELLVLEKQAGIGRLAIPASADALRAKIGAQWQRKMRTHYMPQFSTPLPAIATMFGPRVVPDAVAESSLVHSEVPGRNMPSFADVAFMLGHDRAKTWLAKDLAEFPSLGAKLEQGKAVMSATGTGDLYSAWLSAIRSIAVEPKGVLPSYAKTEAFADYKVNSTVAAYGELRHNYVLLAGQAYDMGGCEIPDGYVEPALPVYEAIRAYAKRGVLTMDTLGVKNDYFARLDKVMSVLEVIVKDELAGRALSEEEKRFLSMVAEIVPPSSDGPGSNDGWYFDLFGQSFEAFDDHALVADWFTSSNANSVVYAGATTPRLGFFVVDTGGEPRVMVGPVARAFEHVGKLDTRLKDTDVAKLKSLREPWAASYVAPATNELPLHVIALGYDAYALKSNRALGPVTIEFLGHHYAPMEKRVVNVGTRFVKVTAKLKEDEWPTAIRVRQGSWVAEVHFGTSESFGGIKEIPEEELYKEIEPLLK